LVLTCQQQRLGLSVSQEQWERLTPNQRAVAQLVGQGKRNAEIAGELGISVASVRHAMRFIHIVLRIHSRRALARSIREYDANGRGNHDHAEQL
jgi:DNA-binding CsgD family transcriptional regulator